MRFWVGYFVRYRQESVSMDKETVWPTGWCHVLPNTWTTNMLTWISLPVLWTTPQPSTSTQTSPMSSSQQRGWEQSGISIVFYFVFSKNLTANIFFFFLFDIIIVHSAWLSIDPTSGNMWTTVASLQRDISCSWKLATDSTSWPQIWRPSLLWPSTRLVERVAILYVP